LARTRLYQEESQRKQRAARFTSADEFLASLEMVARIGRARPAEVNRIAQLTQKTNQFNLTTRRYSEGQIADMAKSPDWAVLTLSPRDCFGELGLSGVLIAQRREGCNWIDSMLMSCRILGRKLEQQFVTTCIERLDAEWGGGMWRAEYRRTKKNRQVEDFWPIFGFAVEEASDMEVRYAAATGELALPTFDFIRVEE
jgi:FkbH-like protein